MPLPDRFQPVGEPQPGLYPGEGRYPGAAWDSQILYRRLRTPKADVVPHNGMCLAREDMTPRVISGTTTMRGRGTFSIDAQLVVHQFRASFTSGGTFSVSGVFASDLSDKLPVVVEINPGVYSVEMADGVLSVELAPTFAVEVEVK